MKRGFLWIVGGMVIAAVAVGAFVLRPAGLGGPLAATISAQTPAQAPTVTIRVADAMLGQISVSGSIAPVEVKHVVLEVDGAVQWCWWRWAMSSRR